MFTRAEPAAAAKDRRPPPARTPADVLTGAGAPLGTRDRSFFESRFAFDFSRVRIHADAEAAASARSHRARAYSFGQHIVFGAGEFAPETPRGKLLLAHELVHVVQQRPVADRLPLTVPRSFAGRPAEAEAREIAPRAVAGYGDVATTQRSSPAVARQPIDVDLEVPSPAERERLRGLGIDLPQVSAASADPRNHSAYIDRKVNAVGFGIYLGGYLAYCDGLTQPIFVPESDVDLAAANVGLGDPSIHPDRAAALAAVPYGPPAPGQPPRNATFYGFGPGAVIVPTLFSPATTPRFSETALRARHDLAVTVQEDLSILAISLLGGMALRAVINRLARPGGRAPEGPTSQPPKPLTSAQMGEVIGWGTGQTPAAIAQTQAVTRSLTTESIRGMIRRGLTRQWVEGQLAAYEAALAKGGAKLSNAQLLPRRELMRRLLELWPP